MFRYEAPRLKGTPIDAAHDLFAVGYELLGRVLRRRVLGHRRRPAGRSSGLIVDLDFAPGDVIYVIEEMIELDAALVFTAAGAAQIIQNRTLAERARKAGPATASLR